MGAAPVRLKSVLGELKKAIEQARLRAFSQLRRFQHRRNRHADKSLRRENLRQNLGNLLGKLRAFDLLPNRRRFLGNCGRTWRGLRDCRLCVFAHDIMGVFITDYGLRCAGKSQCY